MKLPKVGIGFFLQGDPRVKGKEYYIYCRITKKEYRPVVLSTGLKVLKRYWNSNRSRVKPNHDGDPCEMNAELNQLQGDLHAILKKLHHNGERISPQLIKDVHLGKVNIDGEVITLGDIFNIYYNQKKGDGVTKSTLKSISGVRNIVITEFLGIDIPIMSIKNDFYLRFKTFLIRRNISSSTTNQYIGWCKSVLNMAEAYCVDFRNPSRYIQLIKVKREYRAHTQEEIDKILIADVSEDLQPALCMYQLQMKTGMGCAELTDFDPDLHLVKDIESGGDWIDIQRKKNKNMCHIPIDMGDVIPEFAGIPELIKYFAERKRGHMAKKFIGVGNKDTYNKNLNKIADQIGISKFTSHVARHTFATIAINSGWSIEAVANMIGDTIQTTEKVYARLSQKRIIKERKQMSKKYGSS